MNFQDALTALKNGERVARTCWHTKGQYVVIYRSPHPRLKSRNEGRLCLNDKCAPIGHHNLKMALRQWTPRQNDLLADDWEIVPVKFKMDWSFLDNLEPIK